MPRLRPAEKRFPQTLKQMLNINANDRHYSNTAAHFVRRFSFCVPSLICKPSSVVYGHLSGRAVTGAFKRYSRQPSGEQPVRRLPNLAPDGVYTAHRVTAAPVSSYLPFPSLQIALRSVSVALSLESPPPDVIRRPALRCSDFPHGAKRRATVKSTRNF